MNKKIKVNIVLKNLTVKKGTLPLHNLLNHQEIRLLEEAQQNGSSNLNVFLYLLKYAELGASRDKMLLKKILWLLGKRGSIVFNILDHDLTKIVDMKFSFPLEYFELITETPLQELLQKSEPPLDIPNVFWERLKKDLRVFKIVLTCNRKFSEDFKLIDIANEHKKI